METLTAANGRVKGKNLLQKAEDLGSVISQPVYEEENNGRLSETVVDELRKAGFYKLFLPKSLGGLEADPLTTAKVVEEVARHNTAAGWSLMVANSPLATLAHLSQQGIEEIFDGNPDTFVVATVHPPMRATRTKNGYIINGRNPLVSNVHEAEWILVLALVMEDGQLKMHEGRPEMLGVVMKASDCKIIDTWNVLGMRATDSNDVEAIDVFVPDHRLFPLSPVFNPGDHFQGSLYRFPVAGTNIACLLAPVSLAVARNAINELKEIAAKKTPLGSMVPIRERGAVQRKLGKAEALVQSSRAFLHEQIASCWNKVAAGKMLSLEEKSGLLLSAAHANQSSAEAVDLVYTAAGTNGIYMKNKLAHYFTDSQVIRQHGFMNESRYETVAQVYFGLPPDLALIEL